MTQVRALKRAKASERVFPSGPLYWIRFGLGVAAGLICAALGLGAEGIFVGVAIHASSFLILHLAYHVPMRTRGQPRVYYTLGLGTYLAVWFTTWILLNTIKSP